MREVVIVPTLGRPELLYCCLKRLRGYDGDIPIVVFPDRGTRDDVQEICEEFEARALYVPPHDFYGNSANNMNAYLWAYNEGFDRVYMVESDVLVHRDFFTWHRQMHEELPGDIFCSMAWIFCREAPITDDIYHQPWFYSIGVCFKREVLGKIVKHATPLYYADLDGYILKHWGAAAHNIPFGIVHAEQDGLIQRVLNETGLQTVSPGIAKCSHLGFVRSYGDAGAPAGYEELMQGAETFHARVQRIEQLFADPYRRMRYFGRDIVERELGREIENRVFRYRMIVDGFTIDFESDLLLRDLPRRIHSVPVDKTTKIELIS